MTKQLMNDFENFLKKNDSVLKKLLDKNDAMREAGKEVKFVVLNDEREFKDED